MDLENLSSDNKSEIDFILFRNTNTGTNYTIMKYVERERFRGSWNGKKEHRLQI